MPMTSLDSRTSRFLADMNRISKRLDEAEYRITSGKRINKVSDAPDEISQLLAARTQLAATEQVHANLNRVKGEVDTAEGALQQAVNVLERIAVLGTQGASDTIGAGARRSLSDEIGALLEQLVNLAGTKVDGRYIFSGDSDTSAPYTADLGADPPYSVYQGTASTRKVEHPTGALMRISLTAEEIFEDPDPARNVFASVQAMRTALAANDTEAIKEALGRVRHSTTHVNNQLAFYGAAQNQVAEGINFAFKQELRLKADISTLEDADLTEAILELSQARLQQQAAVGAQSQVLNRPTLLDYLK
jgi:flagellar hook-associated protein 3 FlgL